MASLSTEPHYIGIDVGTGSVRAALVSHAGTIAATFSQPIRTWRDPNDSNIFEQSTTDIWAAIGKCTRGVLEVARIDPSPSKALVIDLQGTPVTVTNGPNIGEPGERNVILWADHRAYEEAKLINSTGSDVLKYVGGVMSLEMEIPKTLWLKNHIAPNRFSQCQFFDLPDYLTFKATGDQARSNCSLVCKYSFVPPGGWDRKFLHLIGLGSLVDDGCRRLGGHPGQNGSKVLTAGLPIANGLTERAAAELGLKQGTPVGGGVIDAYAGWIGTVAARSSTGPDKGLSKAPSLSESRHRLAVVAGTSTCHVIQNPEGIFVPGVWGPYQNAIFPGWWMNEGGQSSTGQLIDFVITTHPAYSELQSMAKDTNKQVHVILSETLERLRVEAAIAQGKGAKTFSLTELTKDLHFYPDLRGNRSPLADAKMRGSFVGLSLDTSLNDLALKFNVTLEAIALQTRHILDQMNARGYDVQGIYMSGGQATNTPLMELFSKVCNIPVILPYSNSGAVVVGSAMLGRFAAEVATERGHVPLETQEMVAKASHNHRERLWEIMVDMTNPGVQILPTASSREKKLLEAKYKIFREQIGIQRKWRDEMAAAAGDG
ncbi:hypothetical protein BS47DRAFT_1373269 [Hydnum rufescens UP504]|uniref:Pentulose kinase n=1 Tax=Hydnum rufescens UP504 TaxID=1448309 RepID=A0A9P6AS91_9AGAM|nr:hypothetical protein BS47DRAFT_1373269 [Hydnum rufescens UP504]